MNKIAEIAETEIDTIDKIYMGRILAGEREFSEWTVTLSTGHEYQILCSTRAAMEISETGFKVLLTGKLDYPE